MTYLRRGHVHFVGTGDGAVVGAKTTAQARVAAVPAEGEFGERSP